jgi:hypothetical protein
MITLLIFLLLTSIELAIVLLKWNDVTDIHEIGKFASSAVGYGEHYVKFTDKIILFLKKMKPLLWLISILVLALNLIVASILSFVIHVILHFI